jgi:putative protease
VSAIVTGQLGEPLRVVFRDEAGNQGHAESDVALQPADRHGLDGERLREFLGRLGDTPFQLADVQPELAPNGFLPLRSLNDTRRRAAAALEAERRTLPRHRVVEAALPGLLGQLMNSRALGPGRPTHAELTLLCRTAEQVRAACEIAELGAVYLDFLEVKGARVGSYAQQAGKLAIAASPRILKVDEERIYRFLLGLEADGILVRSLGLLHTLTTMGSNGGLAAVPPLYGDFSLNAANGLTASFLLEQGLQRLAPSHDLNAQQIGDLAKSVDPARLEWSSITTCPFSIPSIAFSPDS